MSTAMRDVEYTAALKVQHARARGVAAGRRCQELARSKEVGELIRVCTPMAFVCECPHPSGVGICGKTFATWDIKKRHHDGCAARAAGHPNCGPQCKLRTNLAANPDATAAATGVS